MSNCKKILLKILNSIGFFVASNVLIFFIFLPFILILKKYIIISSTFTLIVVLGIPVLFSLINTICYLIRNIKLKYTNYSNKYIKLGLLYLLLWGLYISLSNEMLILIEDAKNLLKLQWSLFGLLVGLLVTWCIVVNNAIKIKNVSNKNTIKQRLVNLNQEIICKNNASRYLYNVLPFFLIIMFLSFLSQKIFIYNKMNFTCQTILNFNLYLIIQTIFTISFDIVMPTIINLINEKKTMLNDKQITDEIKKLAVENILTKNSDENVDIS